MRKVALLAVLLLLALPICAQKNDLGLFPLGNLNGGSFVSLESQGGTPVAVSYRSSMGGAVEYRRWLTPRIAVGLWAEMNPSEGILFTDSSHPYQWDIALTRYEFVVPFTARFLLKSRTQPYITAGLGYIVTHGHQPGWSKNLDVMFGAGLTRWINKRWGLDAGMRINDAEQGCYGDPTCKAKIAPAQDLFVGVQYSSIGRN